MMAKLGTVSSVSGTELSVIPDGSTAPITAVNCCGAEAGDRVVLEMHATQALAVAIVGGPHGGGGGVTPADYIIESGTESGWAYVKWASGRAECWREYDLYVSSWAQWGSVYESGQGVPALTFPSGLFVATPAPLVSLRNSSTGVGIMGWETTGGAGSKTASMPLYLMRGTSTGAATYSLYIRFHGRWA